MRLVVGGSAHHAYHDLVAVELEKLNERRRITVVIHGGLGGVCASAEDWARRSGVHVVRYPPNWVRHGKAAEAVRNQFMLADARPDLVVAFPGGPHTLDLVRRALQAGLAVYEVPDREVPVQPVDSKAACTEAGARADAGCTHNASGKNEARLRL